MLELLYELTMKKKAIEAQLKAINEEILNNVDNMELEDMTILRFLSSQKVLIKL